MLFLNAVESDSGPGGSRDVGVNLTALGVPPSFAVRDIWAKKDLGPADALLIDGEQGGAGGVRDFARIGAEGLTMPLQSKGFLCSPWVSTLMSVLFPASWAPHMATLSSV